MKIQTFKIIKYLGNALAILSILFIAKTLLNMDVDFDSLTNIPKAILFFLIGILLTCFGLYILSVSWKSFLEMLGNKNLKMVPVYTLYTKANIGKYLPGNVMHYVERNIFISQQGLGQVEALLSSVFEILGQVFAAFFMSLLLLSREIYIHVKEYFQPLILFFLVLGVFFLCLLIYFLYQRIEKIKKILYTITRPRFILSFMRNIVCYILVFILNGFVLISMISCIRPITDVSMMAHLIAINTLAWLVGFLMPGVPGGIGVRELVLTTLSANTPYADILLVASVLQRLILILSDFIAYFIGILIKRRCRHETTDTI